MCRIYPGFNFMTLAAKGNCSKRREIYPNPIVPCTCIIYIYIHMYTFSHIFTYHIISYHIYRYLCNCSSLGFRVRSQIRLRCSEFSAQNFHKKLLPRLCKTTTEEQTLGLRRNTGGLLGLRDMQPTIPGTPKNNHKIRKTILFCSTWLFDDSKV